MDKPRKTVVYASQLLKGWQVREKCRAFHEQQVLMRKSFSQFDQNKTRLSAATPGEPAKPNPNASLQHVAGVHNGGATYERSIKFLS